MNIVPAIVLVFLFLAINSNANTIIGTVTRIADGDTVPFTGKAGNRYKLRLNAIDAPEKNQPFNKTTKLSLSALCLNQVATVVTNKRDKYGRSISDLFCNGVFANNYQVRHGYAWVFRKYSRDPQMLELESNAHYSYLGLWSAPSLIPPWQWRKTKKEGKKSPKVTRNQMRFFRQHLISDDCSKRIFCKNMVSCSEAQHYLNDCATIYLALFTE